MSTEKEKAIEFLMSQRGQYLVAQALHYGVIALESVTPKGIQEQSNILDMKYLQDELFPEFSGYFAAVESGAVAEAFEKVRQLNSKHGFDKTVVAPTG